MNFGSWSALFCHPNFMIDDPLIVPLVKKG